MPGLVLVISSLPSPDAHVRAARFRALGLRARTLPVPDGATPALLANRVLEEAERILRAEDLRADALAFDAAGPVAVAATLVAASRLAHATAAVACRESGPLAALWPLDTAFPLRGPSADDAADTAAWLHAAFSPSRADRASAPRDPDNPAAPSG